MLAELQPARRRAGILSNGDPDMLARGRPPAPASPACRSGAERRGTGRFKTDPATYALGTRALGLDAARRACSSRATAGTRSAPTWFGYTTLWINRFGLPLDELGAAPDAHRHAACADVLDFFASRRTFAMTLTLPAGVQINAPILPGFETILTRAGARARRPAAPRLRAAPPGAARARARARRSALDAGERPDFLAGTRRHPRRRLEDRRRCRRRCSCRRVEITGPVDAKMVINAFNSGADSYMTDFEDSNSPLWTNQIQGQINIGQAIRRTLTFEQ